MCCLLYCFKEAEGLCVVCYNFLLDILFCVQSSRRLVYLLVIFGVGGCLIFALCFKEAGGLCAVCYFWRRMLVYCLLFYFVCRTAECLCTACYFLRRWLFGICFVSNKGYQVQKFVVLIFYNFVSIFAFICFDICFYCFNLLYF